MRDFQTRETSILFLFNRVVGGSVSGILSLGELNGVMSGERCLHTENYKCEGSEVWLYLKCSRGFTKCSKYSMGKRGNGGQVGKPCKP